MLSSLVKLRKLLLLSFLPFPAGTYFLSLPGIPFFSNFHIIGFNFVNQVRLHVWKRICSQRAWKLNRIPIPIHLIPDFIWVHGIRWAVWKSLHLLRLEALLENSFGHLRLFSVLDRASKSLPSPRSIPELYKKKEQNLKVFSFQELRDSTNGFSRLQELGEGGFGSVYKGIIKPKNGKGIPIWVAIKKLNPHSVQVRLHVWKRICSQRSRKLNPRPSPPESQFRSSFLTSFG